MTERHFFLAPPIRRSASFLGAILFLAWGGNAQPFLLPTSNRTLLDTGGHDDYFVPTPGRDWVSGTFGCVRTEGWQFHEGIDIKCMERDRRGEPIDPIMASAKGLVAYVNRRAGLSNYGQYVILFHQVEGIQVYSLYAHLSEIRDDLKPGVAMEAGERIGTMGRTSNTRQRITKERAHLHFELCFLINDRYEEWHKKKYQVKEIDHGPWSGLNMLGIDPAHMFLQQEFRGANFSLIRLMKEQTLLCRIQVRETDFPWLRRYPQLIEQNPALAQEPAEGFELWLNYAGLPYKMIPRTGSEMQGKNRIELLSVNAEERAKNPCRKLVAQQGAGWRLTQTGLNFINLLLYRLDH